MEYSLTVHLIQDLYINYHKLLSCTTQTVKCSGFDKAFNRALIDVSFPDRRSIKSFRLLNSPPFSFLDDRLDHWLSDTLDRRQTITDIAAVNGEALLISGGRILIPHLSATVNVL